MSTFRIGKVESVLTSLAIRKKILEKQMSEASLEAARQYIAGRISELDMVIGELAENFAIENVSTEERQPEKKGQTIEKLRQNGFHDRADQVRDWRNKKSGNHFGWDSWFVSEFGEDFAREYDIHTVLVSRK